MSSDTQTQFWAEHGPADAQPYNTEEHGQYILRLPFNGRYPGTFAELSAMVGAVDTQAAALSNPFSDKFHELRAFELMDKSSAALRKVFTRILELAHLIHPSLSNAGDDKNLEWRWLPVAQHLIGAGEELWPYIYHKADGLYPEHGLIEDYDEQVRLCVENERYAYWAWGAWHYLEDSDEPDLLSAYKFAFLSHLLRHCWLSGDGGLLIVTYNGTQAKLKINNASNTLSSCVADRASLYATLHIPAKKGKKDEPPTCKVQAAQWAMSTLTTTQLLRRRPLSDLPASIIHGPWSAPVPRPAPRQFILHGHSLQGVWMAHKGVITELRGDDDDVMLWDWPTGSEALSPELIQGKRELEAALPETYIEQSPAALTRQVFPNLSYADATAPVADDLLFDAVLMCDLLRNSVPVLRREMPLIMFLPSVPDFDNSTNQGKSAAAEYMARIMAPGISVCRVADTMSAPDQRAAADRIRQYGTIALDEWRPPRNADHLLAHDNLQSLITGGTVTSGRVMENTGEIRLFHSIVASAKAIQFPPDMINRSLFIFLNTLTPEQRTNSPWLRGLRDGTLSLQARLGLYAEAERENYSARLLQSRMVSSETMRFEGLNTLIDMMCEARSVPRVEVDRSILAMRRRYGEHLGLAGDTGVLRAYSAGAGVAITIADLFDIGPDQCRELRSLMESHRGRRDFPLNTTILVKALKDLYGIDQRENNSKLIARITGDEVRMASRGALIRISTAVKERLTDPGIEYMLPGLAGIEGWCIRRSDDHLGMLSFEFFNKLEAR